MINSEEVESKKNSSPYKTLRDELALSCSQFSHKELKGEIKPDVCIISRPAGIKYNHVEQYIKLLNANRDT